MLKRKEGKTEEEIHALENPELENVEYEEEVVKKDRTVKIGIRPEAFTIDPKGGVPVVVEYVQRVGRDVSMIGQVHGQEKSSLKIIIPVENWKDVEGKDNVNFKPKRFYVFEESGERIK